MFARGREVGLNTQQTRGRRSHTFLPASASLSWEVKETKQNPQCAIRSIYKLRFGLFRGNYFFVEFAARPDLNVWSLARRLFLLLHYHWKLEWKFLLCKTVKVTCKYFFWIYILFVAASTVFTTVPVPEVAVSRTNSRSCNHTDSSKFVCIIFSALFQLT